MEKKLRILAQCSVSLDAKRKADPSLRFLQDLQDNNCPRKSMRIVMLGVGCGNVSICDEELYEWSLPAAACV